MSKNRKYKSTNSLSRSNCVDTSNDPITNLLNILEKSKNVSSNGKLKTEFSSINTTLLDCINRVNLLFNDDTSKGSKIYHKDNSKMQSNELNEKFSKLIVLTAETIHLNKDQELCNKMFSMLSQVLERQVIHIVKIYLPEIINKWLKLNDRLDPSLKPLYIRSFASFILGNIPIMEKDMFASVGLFFFKETEKYLTQFELNENLECLKYCISGLSNLCYIPENWDFNEQNDFLAKRFQICSRYITVFIDCLENSLDKFKNMTQISLFRLQHQCLHGLNYVCIRPHGLAIDCSTRLLKVLRSFCGFGLFRIVREYESSTILTSSTEQDDNGDNGFSTILFDSTDDGIINNETMNYNRPMIKWEQKSRKLAIELLLKILNKTTKKMSTEMWSQYMPVSTYGSRRFNLINLLEKEKDLYTKQLILSAIQEFFHNCKEFLATALYQSNSSAYLSLSHNLAIVVYDIHKRLLNVLMTDKTMKIRLSILKCMSLLIQNVLYHRLQTGLLTLIVVHLRQLFFESQYDNGALRCGILNCFTSLISLESVSSEMKSLLVNTPCSNNDPISLLNKYQLTAENSKPSWLVQLCVKLAHSSVVDHLWATALASESWNDEMDPLVMKIVEEYADTQDIALRCQALVTVGAILNKYDSVIRPSLDILKQTLLACLDESMNSSELINKSNDENTDLRAQVLRVFAGFLNTLDNKKERRFIGILHNSEKEEYSGGCGDVWKVSLFAGNENTINVACDWWSSFLTPVLLCLQDNSCEKVRWCAAQCLSLVNETVLETNMDNFTRIMAWKRLLEMFNDHSIGVSCQAVWALGYWAVMRPLNQGSSVIDESNDFTENLVAACGNVIKNEIIVKFDLSKGSGSNQRSRFSVAANCVWALGNVVEVLVAHNESLLTPQNLGFVEKWTNNYKRLAELINMLCDCCGSTSNAESSSNTNFGGSSHVAAYSRLQENAVRCLGLLCRLITDVDTDHSLLEALKRCSQTFSYAFQLSDKAGKVKVKWNACLCVSHVFRNTKLITKYHNIIDIKRLLTDLSRTICRDRYFKVRNNAIFSLLTYLQHKIEGQEDICISLLTPLSKACISVAQNTAAVPFSEVHRHCLCLYMLNFTILRILIIVSPISFTGLNTELHFLLKELSHDHLPLVWQHLLHLNRSFNKSALLPNTLMIVPPIKADYAEMDCIVNQMKLCIDNMITSNSTTIDLYRSIVNNISNSRPTEMIANDKDNKLSISTTNSHDLFTDLEDSSHYSYDGGLLTKRPGANLIFSQIYD